jgi:hypothetical protein
MQIEVLVCSDCSIGRSIPLAAELLFHQGDFL